MQSEFVVQVPEQVPVAGTQVPPEQVQPVAHWEGAVQEPEHFSVTLIQHP